ncbi:interleukin-13 receptor subunit alpha-2 [Thalassophryne amazonica]|uniref:interleukin-13 receptor subunit alpha-2 n=1 Tax=Thalassophryne amazonica TaxID=390379 RepID=UPI001470D26B|nr:interleukin-13 receptor subunit alpha-2 [Thalassophryne amazonica]XP_034034432.1 interleukin-13 receptor subunit alpha-2 [Thalassophryne amazonica]
MMVRKSLHAALMLFLIRWTGSIQCSALTVDPPEELVIFDPGHLGCLQIQWRSPSSLNNITECQKRFQLEYYDSYQNQWSAIRTPESTYSVQFDLMNEIRVRVYTVLTGPCTNGSVLKSTNYTELVQQPPSTGIAGTTVQGFVCVFHNMEYLECRWDRSPNMPLGSQQNLYFWHRELKQTEECPKYIMSNGHRIGCNFTGKALPDFTDINVCVNGSSPQGPLKPTFFCVQIQNQVKPDISEKVWLQKGPQSQLEVLWESPAGRIPGRCLEWEVEHNEMGSDKNILLRQTSARKMSLTLNPAEITERSCFRVRSRLNKYCADKAFWSNWSHWTCHSDNKEVPSEPLEPRPVYTHAVVAVILIVVLVLCLVGFFQYVSMCKNIKEFRANLSRDKPGLDPESKSDRFTFVKNFLITSEERMSGVITTQSAAATCI